MIVGKIFMNDKPVSLSVRVMAIAGHGLVMELDSGDDQR